MKLKFAPKYTHHAKGKTHANILAMPRPKYQGKDFFQRADFRGLLLSDYQEALGSAAAKSVEQIN